MMDDIGQTYLDLVTAEQTLKMGQGARLALHEDYSRQRGPGEQDSEARLYFPVTLGKELPRHRVSWAQSL